MHSGTIGEFGCLSFNGNKIITCGGGGMLLTNDDEIAKKAYYLSTQAKDDPNLYIHNHIGYNFRLTNIQAAVGLAQLELLESKLKKKKEIHLQYKKKIAFINGLEICEVPEFASNNHWLNILNINSVDYGFNRLEIMSLLAKQKIEARPIWYLNHLQRPYQNYLSYKIENALKQVENSLCLPSSPDLKIQEIDKIVRVLNE